MTVDQIKEYCFATLYTWRWVSPQNKYEHSLKSITKRLLPYTNVFGRANRDVSSGFLSLWQWIALLIFWFRCSPTQPTSYLFSISIIRECEVGRIKLVSTVNNGAMCSIWAQSYLTLDHLVEQESVSFKCIYYSLSYMLHTLQFVYSFGGDDLWLWHFPGFYIYSYLRFLREVFNKNNTKNK